MIASIVPALRAPIPWHIEYTGPDIDPILSSVVLVCNIIYLISPISDGPAVCDHPPVQVFVPFETDGDDTTVTVPIGYAPNPVGQGEARLLSAAPALATGMHAELATFGGVNAE